MASRSSAARRRGSPPSHLQRLSTLHVVDDPPRGDLLVDHLAVNGDGELVTSVYPHRGVPIAVLTGMAVLLATAASAYDRWLDPDETPSATVLTAVGGATAILFAASASGHPGFQDLIGAALVGAMIGVPSASALAWSERAVMRRPPRGGRSTA